MTLRVVQWNVSYLESAQAVGDVLASLKPDVCLLQEVALGYGAPGLDVAAELGRRLGMYVQVVYGPNQLPDGGVAQLGNAILSRWPLTNQRSVVLQPAVFRDTKLVQTERRYVEATVMTPAGRLCAGSAHLLFHPTFGTTPGKRAMVEQIRASLPVKGPFVLGIDMNAAPGTVVAQMMRTGLRTAGPPLSAPTWTQQPTAIGPWRYDAMQWRLDYLLYRGLARRGRGFAPATAVSDHRPMVGDFELTH